MAYFFLVSVAPGCLGNDIVGRSNNKRLLMESSVETSSSRLQQEGKNCPETCKEAMSSALSESCPELKVWLLRVAQSSSLRWQAGINGRAERPILKFTGDNRTCHLKKNNKKTIFQSIKKWLHRSIH